MKVMTWSMLLYRQFAALWLPGDHQRLVFAIIIII
jgi:hypothetical protein